MYQPSILRLQMSSTEITIEGDQKVVSPVEVPLTPKNSNTEQKTKGKPIVPKQGKDTSRIFYEVHRFTASLTDVGVWKEVTIDPYNKTAKGGAFNLPFRRNLWHAGSSSRNGYSTTVTITLMVTCPPMVSGYIEVVDSLLPTNRYIFSLTARGEVPLVPLALQLTGTYPIVPRHFVQPQQQCKQSKVAFRYRISSMNRSAEIASVKVVVMAMTGNTTFNRPIKPKPRNSSIFNILTEDMNKELQELRLCNGGDPSTLMDPIGDESDEGELNVEDISELYDEDIHQDTWKVPIYDEYVAPEDEIVIPLNLPVLEDVTNPGIESTISQPFERFAHAHPTKKGDWGPIVGKYVINVRLPAHISGQIAHVCLPGDEMESITLRAFGIGNILNFATSAISAIGGAGIGGFLNTAANIIKPILGIGDSASEVSNNQANPTQITGDIPISRYINLIKPIIENYVEDPVFGALLFKLINIIDSAGTRAASPIPVQVFAQLDGLQFDRYVTERTVSPTSTFSNMLALPMNQVPSLIEELGTYPEIAKSDSNASILYTKLMKITKDRIFIARTRANRSIKDKQITFKEIEDCEVTIDDYNLAYNNKNNFKRYLLTNA